MSAATQVIKPVAIGPTWRENPDWDQKNEADRFVLPEITLGWQILAWIPKNLRSPNGKPFTPTPEQSRFILWLYEVDENGRFVSLEAVLQRLKGWGKDPLAAVICAVEFVGPCRFEGWIEENRPDLDLEVGDPYAVPNPAAWIQIAAVSREQNKNTMTIFPSLFSPECKKRHKINPGKEIIYAYGGARRIESVTSSPKALEGGRPTFCILNETHHWLSNNEGHEMVAVIRRNLAKIEGGEARSLSITNAYEPSQNSVAQVAREAYEEQASGLSIGTGMLYDSLEAPPDALLNLPKDPVTGEAPSEDQVKGYIAAVLEAVRGDASWLNVERLVSEILNPVTPPSQSRRFYYNQIVASEDAWVDPAAVDAAISDLATEARRGEVDKMRAGWIVTADSPIVMFFDGSKSDDATGVVGCELSTGYVFTIGVWAKPPGTRSKHGHSWQVPRNEVDARITEAFERFTVSAFFADPSHAVDDEAERYWDGLIDDWHRRYKDRLVVHATRSGDNMHSIMWDMASPQRSSVFTGAAEQFVEEIETKDSHGAYAPPFEIDGHPMLVQHLRNARKFPGRFGTSLWKGGRESEKKIDLAVCAVGVRMLRRMVLNRAEDEKPVKGKVAGRAWGY